MTSATAAAPAARTVEVDGCPISYLRAGSGPPLLFLHGAGGVPGWLPWMERLAAEVDLIVPDHPGFGRSAMPPWLDNIHDLAYFYLDFLKALALERVHLVGHSLGGWIACELAIRTTAPLRTLTLIAPAGLRAIGVDTFDVFINAPDVTTRAAFHDPAFAERALAVTPTDEQFDIVLRNRFATARVAWQPRFFDPHLHKWLHRIDVPTQLVWGADDRILPAALATEFTTRIPAIRETILPACGHVPLVEKPDPTLAAITSFVKDARP